MTEANYWRWVMGLLVCGAVLRLVGMNWDEGRLLHPDEGNLVRGAQTLWPDGGFIPSFHAYNDLALWLPRLLALAGCDPHDAGCIARTSRMLSAGFSIAAIPIAAEIARRLAGPASGFAAGVIAAAMLAMSAPLIQWAHFGTTESVLIFLVVAVWLTTILWLDGTISDIRMMVISSMLIGVGFGFKTTAGVVAMIPLVGLVLAGRPDARRLRLVVLGAILAVMLALAATPSIIFAWEDWRAVMRFENDVVTGRLPVFWTRQFDGTTAGLYELRGLWSATAGGGLLLGLMGLAFLPRASWRLAVPGIIFCLVYGAIVFGWSARFHRYLAPLIPVILILAAVGAARLGQPSYGRTIRALVMVCVAVMCLAGIDQAATYLRTDPRIAAEAVLETRALPEDIVAVEPHDVPQTGGLATLTLPLTDPAVTAEILAKMLAEADWLVIASRRNWEVLPRQPGGPAIICRYYASLSTGELGFVPFTRVTRDGPFGSLFAPGITVEETRVVFDRPEVIVMVNVERITETEIADRLSAPADPADCSAQTLATRWKSPT
jgi:hypothetical protein